jgi:hypothetical protein
MSEGIGRNTRHDHKGGYKMEANEETMKLFRNYRQAAFAHADAEYKLHMAELALEKALERPLAEITSECKNKLI